MGVRERCEERRSISGVTVWPGVFASIPSPEHGVLHLGPIPLHAYGLMLAIGILTAVRLAEPRAVARGFEPGLVNDIALKVIIGGIVGARVYHLFTGYDWEANGLLGTLKIWEGGLSIWGAVIGGLIPVVWISRRRKLDAVLMMDAMAPCVALAQGIGRWGNWFNQELFGRPTDLPWGLEIDAAHRPAGYEHVATFHPTFLYESLWCVLIFVVITRLDRRGRLQRGQSLSLYIALYCFERFFMELLRIDDATKVFGLRFNALLSAVLFVVGCALFVRFGRRRVPEPAETV